jgi:DDE superfamily endonuclease
MEYLAKILNEVRHENLWKYDFLDLETGNKGQFYNNKKINYFPSLAGKLKLELSTLNDQQIKTYQSFNQDIFDTEEEFERIEKLEASIKLREKVEKGVSQANSKFVRKLKGIAPQQIRELHNRKKGYTWKFLTTVFKVNERTLRRKAKPVSRVLQKVGRKRKITDYNLSLLCNDFVNDKERKISNQQEMAEYYKEERKLEVHRSTISRTITREEQTYKKATIRYWEQIPRMGEIADFTSKHKHQLANSWFMALDECKINPTDTILYDYSRKGCSAIKLRQGKGRINYTILLCIRNTTKNGAVHHEVVKRSANSEVFHHFLSNIKFPKLPNDEKIPLLMDNVKFHWCPGGYLRLNLPTVQEFLASKNVEIIWAVRYVSEINPTEKCNNTAKDFIRKYLSKCRIRNERELFNAVDGAIELLNEQDMTKYFKSAFEYKIS